MTATQSGRPITALSLVLFLGLMVVYSGFHHRRDWNTASRLLLTYAIVQHGSVEITPFVARNGRLIDHPATRDLSSPRDGEFYCDKAPGHSFLGVVPYWLALRLGGYDEEPAAAPSLARARVEADYWVTLATSGMLTAASAVLIFAFLRRSDISTTAAMTTALAFALATIALPYATLFYGHSSAGFFCLASALLGHRWPRSMPACALAGMLAGFAVVIEYPVVVFPLAWVASNSIAALVRGERWRWSGISSFAAGGLPMAALLAWYHFRITGSVGKFPYAFEVNPEFAYHRSGVPIGCLDLQVAWQLLFGAKRGLIWFSPVLLAAIPGTWRLALLPGGAILASIVWATFLGLFVVNCGFPAWTGGLATGPRFLAPAFALLMLTAGFWMGRKPSIPWVRSLDTLCKLMWSTIALASGVFLIACNVVGARIDPEFPRHPFFYPWTIIAHQKLGAFVEVDEQLDHFGEWVVRNAFVATRTAWPGYIVTLAIVLCVVVFLLFAAWRVDRLACAGESRAE